MERKHRIVISAAIVVALIVVLYFVSGWITRTTGYSVKDGTNRAIIKCLSEKNVIIYGSKNCAECDEQKKAFGNDFELVNYVECIDKDNLCAGLSEVPAWQINGQIHYGIKSIAELKQLSGC